MKEIKLSDWKRFDDYFKNSPNYSFWACFPSLFSSFNAEKVKLLWAKDSDGNDRIVSQRNNPFIDSRILFDQKKDADLIEQLYAESDHVGYAFTSKASKENIIDGLVEENIIQNLQDIVKLKGYHFKTYRRNLHNFQREYSAAEIRKITKSDKSELVEFFNKWAEIKEKTWNYKVSVHHDIFLIDKFLDSKSTHGTVILIDDKIVGVEVSSYSPSRKDMAVSLIKKNFSEPVGLGVALKVAQAKSLIEKGFEKVNVSNAGKLTEEFFKKRMAGNEKVPQYAFSVAIKPEKMYQFTRYFFNYFITCKPEKVDKSVLY
jgi:hypothetical protein